VISDFRMSEMIMKNSSQMMAIRERQQTNAEHRFSRYIF